MRTWLCPYLSSDPGPVEVILGQEPLLHLLLPPHGQLAGHVPEVGRGVVTQDRLGAGRLRFEEFWKG